MRHAELTSRIQFAVARKLLEQQEMQGVAAVKLIQSAGETATRASDNLAAAATGLGSMMDVLA